MIQIKTDDEIARMRAAGLVVCRALAALRASVRPGISTADLDAIAEECIRDDGAVPSFLGYRGFPARICTSVNEEVVHGIPRPDKVLREGDVISIDCGAIVDGWHGDSAITVGVGEIRPEHARMMAVCEESMWAGFAAALAGGKLTDISHAVEVAIRGGGDYGIVDHYGGHGIGTEMHQDPHVLNYGRPGRGPRLVPGLCLAIEPMITMGGPETRELEDGWTVVTTDGSYAAHYEHTVAITADGPWVLTAEDSGAAKLAEYGVQVPARTP
ncbi:MAG TPA: type I methionyl aminopeptidase [Mycobacteriales bacterium]|nr:type I methionyl aminopeptidase [Mycobacteriales bacterium]